MTLLVAISHFASLQWAFGYRSPRDAIACCDGELLITESYGDGPVGFFAAGPPDRTFHGLFPVRHAVPLWVFALPAAIAAYSVWRTGRARATGACSRCGYDLAGLPAGNPCPECAGSVSEADPLAAARTVSRKQTARPRLGSLAAALLMVIPLGVGIGWSQSHELAYAREGLVVFELIGGEARLDFGARTHRYPFSDGFWIGESHTRSLGSSYHPSIRIPLWIPLVMTIGVYGAGWFRSWRAGAADQRAR